MQCLEDPLLTWLSVAQSEWTAEFEFRATGPERGGGNLQIWYTKEGRPQAETPSIYTTGAFDGLALVIDMYGGKVGDPASVINPMLIRENIGWRHQRVHE